MVTKIWFCCIIVGKHAQKIKTLVNKWTSHSEFICHYNSKKRNLEESLAIMWNSFFKIASLKYTLFLCWIGVVLKSFLLSQSSNHNIKLLKMYFKMASSFFCSHSLKFLIFLFISQIRIFNSEFDGSSVLIMSVLRNPHF